MKLPRFFNRTGKSKLLQQKVGIARPVSCQPWLSDPRQHLPVRAVNRRGQLVGHGSEKKSGAHARHEVGVGRAGPTTHRTWENFRT
ncbi:hypothetical protein PGT21_029960 [Puccinia graminis f. sp. tritici]|uniref:Uncharacterized protein n=1 Tax=Puccinia graminis f. sp. tritici TaxID=56615 RepID=A0A5B0QXK3_PUCGR|nr:hypothetical protein PGT21_029960 [Puccinia graminis f. sp. tritici]